MKCPKCLNEWPERYGTECPRCDTPLESGSICADLFSVSSERDWPWGEGENDNYGCVCVACDLTYRGHKHSHVCRKCSTALRESWKAMSESERETNRAYVVEQIRKFYAENVQVEARD